MTVGAAVVVGADVVNCGLTGDWAAVAEWWLLPPQPAAISAEAPVQTNGPQRRLPEIDWIIPARG